MLDSVNMKSTISKEEFKKQSKKLEKELETLPQRIKEAKIPVIILFEGWGAAGKGSIISELILNFDPRGFKVYSTTNPTEEERRHPPMWRHWKNLPEQGLMSILDRSWYQDVSVARVEEDLPDAENLHRMNSINTFERQLTDNGYLILKFFLHISQKEQKARFDKLEEDKNTAWRVNERDRWRNKHYNLYYRTLDEMLEYTNTPNAPWHVVCSNDSQAALLSIYRTVLDSVQDAIEMKKQGISISAAKGIPAPKPFNLVHTPLLSEITLEDKTITDEKYKRELAKLQKKLKALHYKLYRRKLPVIVAYEGWDAAGKGGNIKRISAALDPRGYEVIPIAAPTKPELNRHYLWRFWTKIPKTGHIAIFDRTWYGRVMVERIEGFCTEEDWKRAYQEMNEFERELTDWGAVVVKFWIHIDQDEQLRRFTDRQNTPEKQWKITEEDWRNREKWPQYEVAVNDMLQKTSTEFAPWHIIESQDKKYARIKTLKILIKAIEDALK